MKIFCQEKAFKNINRYIMYISSCLANTLDTIKSITKQIETKSDTEKSFGLLSDILADYADITYGFTQ